MNMQRPQIHAKKQTDSRKTRVNLTVSADVVAAAKDHGFNLSEVAETALRKAVAEAEHAAWLERNAEALEFHRKRVESGKMYNEGLRTF